MKFREANDDDIPFMWTMLYEAVYWNPDAARPEHSAVKEEPDAARYLQDWGRHGDHAQIADSGAELIGAAWYRLFTAEDASFGFVDEETPELVIGVVPIGRGEGVGSKLMQEVIITAKRAGFQGLSLNVIKGNPIREWYLQLGFQDVARTAFEREGIAGCAYIMHLVFSNK